MTQALPKPLTEYIEASNTFDGDRLIAAFAGDEVTMDVKEVREHYGEFIVDAVVDGNFDKSKLPDVIVLTHYFTVRKDKIVRLIIILNTPAE
jgi:hypothetical protein